MGVRIITDSGSDIRQETAKKWGVTVLPLSIRFGEEEFLDDVTITSDELYTRMIETGEIPQTSQVPPFSYELAFAEAVEAGDSVVCITLSSGMSGCYQSACIAAKRFDDRVTVIDSLGVCASQYVLVRYAQGMVRMNKSYEEIVHRVNRDRKRLHVISLVDTLEYVHKGGRLSLFKTLAGSALSIKPIITADKEGKVQVLGNARGRKNSFRRYSEYIEAAGGIDFSLPVCMAYSGLSDQNMRDYMKQEAALFEGHENQIHRAQFGATVGTYSGPGAIAIGFFHKRVAEFG